MEKLITETNTEAIRRRILKAARRLPFKGKFQADFEHGQWWITHLSTGAQWSVVDVLGADYGVDFEQVTTPDD